MEHDNMTETSTSEFWYESVNSSLEKLINMKKLLFSTRTVQIAKSPKIRHALKCHFFNLQDSSLDRHANAASRTNFIEIQTSSNVSLNFKRLLRVVFTLASRQTSE